MSAETRTQGINAAEVRVDEEGSLNIAGTDGLNVSDGGKVVATALDIAETAASCAGLHVRQFSQTGTG